MERYRYPQNTKSLPLIAALVRILEGKLFYKDVLHGIFQDTAMLALLPCNGLYCHVAKF